MKNPKINDQWPDALLFLSEALKAGLNVEGAMDVLTEKAPSPLQCHLQIEWKSREWQTIDIRIARVFSDPSLALARMALLLAYETGGGVASILETAAALLKTKHDMKDRVQTMTLQGKASAWVVGLSPFFVLVGFLVVSPDYMAPLFTTRSGGLILGLVVLMNVVGLFFVHRAARLEV